MKSYVQNRNGYFYYCRRVPEYIRKYDKRSRIDISLKTKDPKEAARRAEHHNDIIEKFWEGLIKSPHLANDQAYKDAVAAARIRGFAYRTIDELSAAPLGDTVSRLLSTVDASQDTKLAVMGLVDKPSLILSNAFEGYLAVTKDRVIGKNDVSFRRWKHSKLRALNNFITAVGDRDISRVTRRDILDFKKWWMDRVITEELRTDSANKDLQHLKDLIRTLTEHAEIEIDVNALFAQTALKAQNESRQSFEAQFVQDKILNPAILGRMNTDAQAIVYIMADTGARISEVVGLEPRDIILKAEIPHIWIRANKRGTLKTANADRKIPLVGAALVGAKLIAAKGTTRFKTANVASAAINKFFTDHDLKPTKKHSLYSLRHTFKDRLRDIGAPEEIMDNLMGHASDGPKYGRGHILETKLLWMNKIAFKV